MENLTNQILELDDGSKYFVLRQAAYKGKTYYFAGEIEDNEEEFTGEFIFLEKINSEDDSEGGGFSVEEVVDPDVLRVLAKNIKLD